jgi:uncharacterized membrane protein
MLKFFTVGAGLFLLFASASCTSEKVTPTPVECTDSIHFTHDVLPILTNKCGVAGCHDSDPNNSTGDFTSYTDVKIKADAGLIRNRLLVVKDMPPAGNASPTELELQKINCWLKQGAKNN